MLVEFKPHDYQSYCIKRVVEDKSIGLFLDMGLGKTIISLMAINELKFNRFEVYKFLVIAPKKVAEATWQKEKDKWDQTKHLRISEVLGSRKQRLDALEAKADIYVINRDNVVWLVDHYKHKWPFDMVIVDEFSSFKNHQAKRFKALAAIRPHIKRFVGLTGTPSPNGLEDLWAQVYLLDGGKRLEDTISKYRARYFMPDKRNGHIVYSYRLRTGSSDAILAKISDICISMKADDYLQLPDVVDNVIPVVLDKKAQKAYTDMERKMVLEVEDGEVIDAASAAALSNKLLQLSNGAIYDEERGVHEIHDAKLQTLQELLEQLQGKSALVFYNYKHDLTRIQRMLANQCPTLKVRRLDDRDDVDTWNRGEIDVLLTHPASSAYGLNLQEGGNHVIWFGLQWNYELYTQANKRLHRQGQKEKVIIHHLVTQGTRDEDVMEALGRKEDVQEYVLESLKARIKKYKELEECQSYVR